MHTGSVVWDNTRLAMTRVATKVRELVESIAVTGQGQGEPSSCL